MRAIQEQTPGAAHIPTSRGGWSRHPTGLFTLFSVEAWERFSFYGMRALLILFMTSPVVAGGLEFDVATAGAVYGIFTAAVYLLSLPGGWLADKLIGQQAAVISGGIFIALGNLIAAVPAGLVPFFTGLALTAVGVGLLKPNVSVMVGELYDNESSARRDAGFSIFYFGIYLGAFTSPLVAGSLGENFGYRLGFALTGVAMLLGTFMFARVRWRLGDIGTARAIEGRKERNRCWLRLAAASSVLALVMIVLGQARIGIDQIAAGLGLVIGAVFIGYFAYMFTMAPLTTGDRRNVAVIVVLCLCTVLFTSGLEQAGSTMNLFARDFTDRSLMGDFFNAGQHPATWYQSIGPFFVLLLSPLFAILWVALGRRNLNPSTPLKFGLSLVLLGLSFATMALAVQLSVAIGFKAAPGWLVTVYFVQAIAELFTSPIGLSAVSRLSPRSYGGQMMGMWFLAAAAGNLVAGLVGGWMGSAGTGALPGQFLLLGGIGIAGGVAMMIAAPAIRRLMSGG